MCCAQDGNDEPSEVAISQKHNRLSYTFRDESQCESSYFVSRDGAEVDEVTLASSGVCNHLTTMTSTYLCACAHAYLHTFRILTYAHTHKVTHLHTHLRTPTHAHNCMLA